jgi:hypothetical protein
MKDKRNPLKLAISSIVFPSLTAFVGSYIILRVHEAGPNLGLAAVYLLPLLLFSLVIIGIGVTQGILVGMQALRLAKNLPANEKSRVVIYAWLGIVLSVAEIAYFYVVWSVG